MPANAATPSVVVRAVVPLSGPKPEPGASDSVIGTVAPGIGSPEPSTTRTVTGGPDGSNGVPVIAAPTSAAAGSVPKARSQPPETGVTRSPTTAMLLPGGPLNWLDCLASTVHAPLPL